MGVTIARKLLLHLLILLIAQHVQPRKIIEANPIPNVILGLPSYEEENIIEGGQDEYNFNNHKNIIYDASKPQHHAHSSTNHMDHMDTNIRVFFTLKDLKLGQTLPIYFPKKDLKKAPHFLPRDEAESIPFSSKELGDLLGYFSFAPDSPQATAMEETLTQCEARPIQGETKACLTSLESMLDFVGGAFRPGQPIASVATAFLTESNTTFQNYTVSGEPKEIPAPEMVACHTMPYPYAVFYCHYQESESRVYKVALRGENGDEAEALAVCHMDTAKWSPSHMSFRVLGFGPGTLPVCHFFPAEHLVWVPEATIYSSAI